MDSEKSVRGFLGTGRCCLWWRLLWLVVVVVVDRDDSRVHGDCGVVIIGVVVVVVDGLWL